MGYKKQNAKQELFWQIKRNLEKSESDRMKMVCSEAETHLASDGYHQRLIYPLSCQ